MCVYADLSTQRKYIMGLIKVNGRALQHRGLERPLNIDTLGIKMGCTSDDKWRRVECAMYIHLYICI